MLVQLLLVVWFYFSGSGEGLKSDRLIDWCLKKKGGEQREELCVLDFNGSQTLRWKEARNVSVWKLGRNEMEKGWKGSTFEVSEGKGRL